MQTNIKEEIHNQWLSLQKAERKIIEMKTEKDFIRTLTEKQKLMYTNLELENEYSVHFKEKQLIYMVLKYISDLCNPRSGMFFD